MQQGSPKQGNAIPKMMIAFVIRRCTVALGHTPDAKEFAAWANNQVNGRRRYCLFGRPISELEARVILKHQARLVSAKSAHPEEQHVEDDSAMEHPNVVLLDRARRLLLPRKQRSRPRLKS